ncbi:MAG: HAMP domain-containing protein [Bacteroidetes bacterium]|nr:HAMP domain-containing protein [Bacteroidota bacterium]
MDRRRSVFWPVAGILVGVQVVTGLLAVGLAAWFAHDRSLDLAANSLRLRLDGLAEEVEQRAPLAEGGLADLPLPLRLDLAARFPDPVHLLDADGHPIQTIPPDPDAFDAPVPQDTARVRPDSLGARLLDGDVLIQLDDDAPAGTWGLAPVYDRNGFLAGGLLVQPLAASIDRELAGTRAAYQRALFAVAGLAVVIALLLGAFFTGRLVRPLRRMTRQVERIEAGEYDARIEARSTNELGRLARSINQMAAAVEDSIERLRQTDALRRELIANVGHDLRTPLAAQLGYLEEAQRHLDAGEAEAARQALATAERQGQYLNDLVGDLFELSLLDSAEAPLRREPIPLGELLADAARAHRSAFQEADVAFVVDLPPDLPIIDGDGVRLLRALDNLLTNARRHTPAGGTVEVRARVQDNHVRVEVEDTGSGMDAETQAHVFDRYYRGQDARTRRTSGTGLGLPIARAIARAHGGDLTATSTPGEGSTFTLRLPVPPAAAQA